MFTREELYKLYIEEDKTQKEIGQEYGMDSKLVSYYVRKFGLPKKSRKQVASKNKKVNITGNELLEMVNNGMLINEIAEKYNVTRSAIGRIAKENGLNFRNHKAAAAKQSQFMKDSNPFFDDEIKSKAINNSSQSNKDRAKQTIEKHMTFYEDMSFKEYSKKARYMAYLHYGRGKLIDDDKVIDHLYSVKDGYENKVPLSILSNPNNLRLISERENLSKGYKSDITLKQLYNGVVFND